MDVAEMIAAALVGAMFGYVAVPIFAYFVEGLASKTLRKGPLTLLVALLGGGTVASQPVGKLIASENVLLAYVIGESIAFLPFAIAVVWRYTAAWRWG